NLIRVTLPGVVGPRYGKYGCRIPVVWLVELGIVGSRLTIEEYYVPKNIQERRFVRLRIEILCHLVSHQEFGFLVLRIPRVTSDVKNYLASFCDLSQHFGFDNTI